MANQYDTKRVERECAYCKTVMMVTPFKDKTYENMYCSPECQNIAHSQKMTGRKLVEHVTCNCDNCSNKLYLSEREYKRSKFHFCDIGCRKEGMLKLKAYANENNGRWLQKIEVECANCGKEKLVTKYTFDRNENHFCNTECYGKWCSKNRVGENHPVFGTHPEHLIGENNHNWNNGISYLLRTIRRTGDYYRWKKQIMNNFNGKCIICSDDEIINVHHIVPLLTIIYNNNIKLPEHSKDCEEMWDINNGVVLCKEHHNKFHKQYGVHSFGRDEFEEFVNSESFYNV